MPKFEYDAVKSAANLEKHGIDFETAQALWNDAGFTVQEARQSIERRFVAVARIDGLFWTAVFTRRQGRVRIISVRRSRDGEKRDYFSAADDG